MYMQSEPLLSGPLIRTLLSTIKDMWKCSNLKLYMYIYD